MSASELTDTSQGLRELQDLILLIHPVKKSGSGLTIPFSFHKDIDNLDYVAKDRDTGKDVVDAEKLISWLDFKKALARKAVPTKDEFYLWLTEGKHVRIPDAQMKAKVAERWSKIEKILRALDALDKRLQETKIGYLEVRDCTANDEKKIFEIINTGGTPLTSEEILSAKPAYNRPVENADEMIQKNVRDLYAEIGVDTRGVVRWDIPATLLSRISFPSVLSDEMKLERRLTIGFKLMSGYYVGGVSKDDVSKLSDSSKVAWGTLTFENMMNRMAKALQRNELLNDWRTWQFPVSTVLGDQIAINYLLVLAKDWERKAEPTITNSAKHLQFQRNAATLLDRSIYEYVTRQWRGSGDSKTAANLANLGDDVFAPVPAQKWAQLADELVDEGKIGDRSYLFEDESKGVDSAVKVLLLYSYVAQGRRGPPREEHPVEVDHIIPRTVFATVPDATRRRKCHHIANLCLLPKTPNIQKSNKMLDTLTDAISKRTISENTGVPETEFARFSSPSRIEDLIALRGDQIKEALTTAREARIEA